MAGSSDRDAVAALVDTYRDRCLWFLRHDYYPLTLAEQLTVLGCIERYGDLEAYRRARTVREWLSQISNVASAG